MSTYSEILNQVESLTPDEQSRLLEELAALVRRQITFKNQSCQPELQKVGIDKWRGFLPERVDALEFQKELRQEWDVHVARLQSGLLATLDLTSYAPSIDT